METKPSKKMPNLAETVKLADFLRSRYAESRKIDAEFAEEAEKALGFRVTASNVAGLRRSLEIESNHLRLQKTRPHKEKLTLAERIERMEARLTALEDAVTRPAGIGAGR